MITFFFVLGIIVAVILILIGILGLINDDDSQILFMVGIILLFILTFFPTQWELIFAKT